MNAIRPIRENDCRLESDYLAKRLVVDFQAAIANEGRAWRAALLRRVDDEIQTYARFRPRGAARPAMIAKRIRALGGERVLEARASRDSDGFQYSFDSIGVASLGVSDSDRLRIVSHYTLPLPSYTPRVIADFDNFERYRLELTNHALLRLIQRRGVRTIATARQAVGDAWRYNGGILAAAADLVRFQILPRDPTRRYYLPEAGGGAWIVAAAPETHIDLAALTLLERRMLPDSVNQDLDMLRQNAAAIPTIDHVDLAMIIARLHAAECNGKINL